MDNLYDPRISSLVDQPEVDPIEYSKNLIQYEISPEFDKKAWGMNVKEGEYIQTIAPEKNRKTTMLLNLVITFAKQLRERELWVCVDMLESGISPTVYKDLLICVAMGRLMVADVFGKDRAAWPNPPEILNHPDLIHNLDYGFKALRGKPRTPFQEKHHQVAKRYVSSLPISVFGARLGQGRARNLDDSMKRWKKLIEGKWEASIGLEHRLFITDNIQQISGFSGMSHSQLETVVNAHSDVAAEYGVVVWDVSQVSLTARQEGYELTARGGTRGSEESSFVFETEYDEEKNPHHMIIKTNVARWGKPPRIYQPIIPSSGAFLGHGKLQ